MTARRKPPIDPAAAYLVSQGKLIKRQANLAARDKRAAKAAELQRRGEFIVGQMREERKWQRNAAHNLLRAGKGAAKKISPFF